MYMMVIQSRLKFHSSVLCNKNFHTRMDLGFAKSKKLGKLLLGK